MTNTLLVILPYSAVSFSIVARIIFMYLLYTKKSTNIYSLSFCYLSILSSSLWIPYAIIQEELPILIRSCVEIGLLSVSAGYITYNRYSAPPTEETTSYTCDSPGHLGIEAIGG